MDTEVRDVLFSNDLANASPPSALRVQLIDTEVRDVLFSKDSSQCLTAVSAKQLPLRDIK